MKKYFIIIIFVLINLSLSAYFQTEYAIVDSLSEEWQQAGIMGGELPVPSTNENYIRYITPGMDWSTINDNIEALVNEGVDSNNIGVLDFAPGEYNFNAPIKLKSYIILSGNHMFRRDEDRSKRTIFNFNIKGTGHDKKSCIILGSEQESITCAGIEDILINRIDTGSLKNNEENKQGNNISFINAENCWVYGVESRDPVGHHIRIANSKHIEIAGCYFCDAQFHGEGGYGYGVIIEYGSSHCLVENNIFNKCRHSMLVQNGAHYNVFGYNYVAKGKHSTLDNLELNNCPPWCENFLEWLLGTCISDDFIGDICCHGEPSYENNLPSGTGYRGPYSNLFEGNICNSMWVDSFHGKNKKFNTFFRNRAKKYGLSIFDKLHDVLSGKYYTKRQTKQIAVNNYMKSTYHWTDTWAITSFGITASSIASVIINHNLSITGFYLTIAFLEEYADFTRGRWVDKKTFEKNSIHKRKNFWGQYYTGTWTDNKYKKKSSVAWNDNSYYLSSHPDFWPAVTGLNWSFHPKDSSEIPAKLRYSLFDKKTVSRYDGNNLVTLYITESTVVPEGIDSGLIQNDHLIVPEGVTLVIDPSYTASGIELKFKPGKYFKVRGSLITKGTLEKPIILKGLSDNPDDDGDKWAGMFFGDFASNVNFGDSELNYTIIKDACKLNNTGGGGIRINNSDLYIDNYAQIIFNNCQFRNCKALEGGAVYIYDAYSHPDNTELFVKFKECIFENNIANRGGAVSALQNYAHFINCVFKNNTTIGVLPEYSGCGGAIDYNGEGLFGYPLLLGNLFVNNSAGSAGAVWFKNNNDYSCSPVIINNTFFNNNAENLGGALSFTKPDDDVILINNVFWGNTANYDYSQYNYVPHGGGNQINVELDDETMSCHKFIFKNNNIQSGLENINNSDIDCIVVYNLDANEEPVALTYSASGNINSDPLLNSEDYSITANSPCFNSGISAVNIDDSVSSYLYFQSMDLYGNPRISSSAVDIGACEAYEEGIYIEKQEINLGNVNPDSPVTVSLVLHNENDEYSVNNINCTLSDETDAGLEIINCPSSVSPGGTEIIKLKFAPEIMYKNYSGKIVINSDDPYFPEFIIPFSAYTGFHGGWNWCSFPFADLNEEDILDSFNPFGLFVKTKNGYTEYNVSDNSWSSHGLTNFENNNCYKVKMSSSSKSYDIDLTGGHPYTSKTLYPGVYNWIGYWLLESKNIDDAFGDDFDKVISIKAETWFYDKQNISRGLIPVPVPSNRIRALHYGRGYMVKVSEIIEDFKWGYSGNPLQKDALKKPTVFTFEQKSDYEAIDIIGLSDGDIEIGAFVDSVCIGAAVAENNQAQILAYTQNSGREEQEIYFKILSERGSRSPEGYFIFNQEKNNFEKGKIISNRNDYHIVAFDKNGELNDNIPDKVVLKGNYPNPFNPSTTINFSIPENSEVNLSIYNVKGQKVRTSINKKLEKGYHKVLWNGKNEAGNFVGSGVYLYRLKVNGKTEAVKKCLMLK